MYASFQIDPRAFRDTMSVRSGRISKKVSSTIKRHASSHVPEVIGTAQDAERNPRGKGAGS
jgi:hypothetical protein